MKHGYTHKLKTSSKRHSPKIAIVYSMELLLFVASCLLTSSGSNELHGTRYTSFRTLGWVHSSVQNPKERFFYFPHFGIDCVGSGGYLLLCKPGRLSRDQEGAYNFS